MSLSIVRLGVRSALLSAAIPILGSFPLPAEAQAAKKAAPRGTVELAMLQGACSRLVIGKRDLSPDCTGRLLNTNYPDGRSGFYFVSKGGAALTFSGMGSKQVKLDADTVIQPIDKIIVTSDGKTSSTDAAGECRFTNPNKGPAPVTCRANGASGAFEAAFVSDGRPPEITSINRP